MTRLLLVLGIGSMLLAGCGGTQADPSTVSSAGATPTYSSAAPRLADPAEFQRLVAAPGTTTVNVHVPDEGSLPGTDLAVPYTDVRAQAARLPADQGAPLAVYCRSGNMSADAVQMLVQLGYSNVVELRGGMEAWTASGRALLPPAHR